MTTTASLATSGTREIQFREAVNECLRQEMALDDSVIIMGEEIAGGAGREDQGVVDAWGGPFRTTVGLIQEFGRDRVLDTPLSEAAFIGAAIGASSTGLRAVAELMFIDFIGVCMDQLVNNAAKMRYMFGGQVKVPFTMMTRIGAGFGAAAQHSESYYSIFSHFPGLKGVVPSDAYTAKGLLAAAIRDDDPVVFFEHKGLYGEKGPVPEESYVLPIGKARTVRAGTDITLVGISKMTWVCTAAAEELAKSGIDAEVIDLLSVSPIDYDHVIDSVKRTHRLVVVDEDTPICSLAGDICSRVAEEAFDYLDAPPSRVTAPHTPVPYSRVLENNYVPNEARVISTVEKLFNR
ncbi:MAG: alpha-ketoacid dehydrogenase subunit beta [SAR202 cluster bacterium Io17-Chloro-G4]|nr:MAG: alpha-ketoacid dehydrogenase subunit beta [SAR202 cluster bacterium Io17-Chloro-G4]